MNWRSALLISTFFIPNSFAMASQALRLLCENNSSDAFALSTLRSDVVPDYISKSIPVYDENNSRLESLSFIKIISSTGLEAEAILAAGKNSKNLYFAKVDFARGRATAALIKENIYKSTSPYALTPEGLWIQISTNEIQLYSWQTGTLSEKTSLPQNITGLYSANRELVLSVKSKNSSGLIAWNANQKNWKNLQQTNSANKTLLPASDASADLAWEMETLANGSKSWALLKSNKVVSAKIQNNQQPVVFQNKVTQDFYVSWTEESRDRNLQLQGKLQIAKLSNDQLQVETVAYSEALLKLGQTGNYGSEKNFNSVTFDPFQQAVIMSTGNIGGVVSYSLTQKRFSFHGTLGSSWACFNPSGTEEVTPW